MSTDTPETLPGLEHTGPTSRQGPTETAIRAALEHALLDDRDKAAGELAAQLARAVDVAQQVRRDPYGVATAGRELREQLIRLRLDPASRLGNDAGALEQFLAGIATPTAGGTGDHGS